MDNPVSLRVTTGRLAAVDWPADFHFDMWEFVLGVSNLIDLALYHFQPYSRRQEEKLMTQQNNNGIGCW